LQIGAFFGQNRAFYGANLEANSAIDAGGEVDPVPVCAFGVFARAGMNASNGASIDAIGNAFAGIGNNGVGHGFFSLNLLLCEFAQGE
jgi:hypothetical protein